MNRTNMQQRVFLFSLCPDQLSRSTGVNTLHESKTLYTGVKGFGRQLYIKMTFWVHKVADKYMQTKTGEKGFGWRSQRP